jgi:hypothetical protein
MALSSIVEGVHEIYKFERDFKIRETNDSKNEKEMYDQS